MISFPAKPEKNRYKDSINFSVHLCINPQFKFILDIRGSRYLLLGIFSEEFAKLRDHHITFNSFNDRVGVFYELMNHHRNVIRERNMSKKSEISSIREINNQMSIISGNLQS